MNDFERALKDINAVVNANIYEVRRKNLGGAVPMQLRSVKEAQEALLFKERVMDIINSQHYTAEMIDACQVNLEENAVGYDIDMLYTAFDLLRIAIEECNK